MSDAESERAAIVAELRKRIAMAWASEQAASAYTASLCMTRRLALESAANYIEAGKHNQDTKGSA
jgi:hypothetical protein